MEKIRAGQLSFGDDCRAMFEQSPLPMLVWDLDTLAILDANPAAVRLYGYSRLEFRSMSIKDIRPPEDVPEFLRIVSELPSGLSKKYLVRHRRKDGSIIHVEAAGYRITFDGHDRAELATINDVTELKKAQEELERALKKAADEKARAEAIVAAIGDGISIQDTDFKILYQNEAHKALIGDHVGEHCYEAYERRDRVCIGCPVAEAFRDGRVHKAERTGLADEGPVYVEITASPLRDAGGNIVGGVEVVRDITARKRMEEELRRRIRQQAAVAQFGQVALTGGDVDSLLNDAVALVADILGVEYSKVLRLLPDGKGLLLKAGVGFKEGLAGRAIIDAKNSQAGYTLRTNRPVIVEDFASETRFGIPPLLKDHDVVSGMSVVIGGRERPYGILGAHSVRRRRFTEDDAHFIEAIAHTLADAIERRGLEEEVIQSRRDWEDIFDTITDMITVHDRDFNIVRANKAAQKILGLPVIEAKRVKCFEFYHGTECPPEGCPSCRTLQTGEPAVSELFEPHLNMDIEIRAIPRFDAKGGLIGLIHVVRDISEKKKAEKRIQRHLKRLESLHSIDMAISASLDLRLTMNVILEQVISRLGVDAAAMLLYDPRTYLLEYAAGRGFRSRAVEESRLRVGEGIAGRAALERRIVRVPALGEEAGFVRKDLISGEGFVSAYCAPLIAKGEIKGVLEVYGRSPLEPDAEWLDFLAALATQAAIAIDNSELFNELQRSNFELSVAYDATIEGWSRALDYRDRETKGHSQRVTEMTLEIAREMGVEESRLEHIRRGALLHDIGKLGVPDAILFKPGKLDDEEWEVMKKHPVLAYELLSPIAFLRPALDIPYCHHEKWDGTGYPRGLKGEEIPLAARIFSVVDVWDALSAERPYRPAWPKEKVREYLASLAGKEFDPKVVELFLRKMP